MNNFNWKYIVGEVFLIFVGINLAIWFNNWNTSKKVDKEKSTAIDKIKGEIENNVKEITKARKENQRLVEAFTAYREQYAATSDDIIDTPEHFAALRKKYPGFFEVKDSIAVGEGRYHYTGETLITLELAELTEIAWETTRVIGVTKAFNYDCMYELESMYNQQRRVKNAIEKALDALQRSEITEMMRALEFLSQLEYQLLEDYEEMLINIDQCR